MSRKIEMQIDHRVEILVAAAKEEALKSDLRSAKMSAMIVDKKLKTIFAKTHNRRIMGENGKFSIHAEENMLAKYFKSVKDRYIFIFRTMADGSIGVSRPCRKCYKLIEESGIFGAMYFNKDGQFVVEEF